MLTQLCHVLWRAFVLVYDVFPVYEQLIFLLLDNALNADSTTRSLFKSKAFSFQGTLSLPLDLMRKITP